MCPAPWLSAACLHTPVIGLGWLSQLYTCRLLVTQIQDINNKPHSPRPWGFISRVVTLQNVARIAVFMFVLLVLVFVVLASQDTRGWPVASRLPPSIMLHMQEPVVLRCHFSSLSEHELCEKERAFIFVCLVLWRVSGT